MLGFLYGTPLCIGFLLFYKDQLWLWWWHFQQSCNNGSNMTTFNIHSIFREWIFPSFRARTALLNKLWFRQITPAYVDLYLCQISLAIAWRWRHLQSCNTCPNRHTFTIFCGLVFFSPIFIFILRFYSVKMATKWEDMKKKNVFLFCGKSCAVWKSTNH